ncbi:MAG TPA: transcriptional regulator [Opitutae bacterium]|nr:transcriptional regulator [Puniceicoccaceae bacterium]HBR92735.1 transcriptional regulator [Opitutae bacterium]|tara:strand:- start:8837 stop:9121 length:285 start_codon:yes stop_codon:yes gene_type:complete
MNIISIKDLAGLIKQERKSRGWTQVQLAERSGVSRDWIIGLEKAKPSVELGLVLRTLKALHLPLEINQSSQSVQDGIDLNDILNQTRQRDNESS